jgi:hypothetical protein
MVDADPGAGHFPKDRPQYDGCNGLVISSADLIYIQLVCLVSDKEALRSHGIDAQFRVDPTASLPPAAQLAPGLSVRNRRWFWQIVVDDEVEAPIVRPQRAGLRC